MTTIAGGCLCGAVRYQAELAPQFAVLCHCRDCQRLSGSGHVPVMGVPKSSFVVRGATKAYSARGGSGLAAVRHFCPVCGSLLFGMAEIVPDIASIYVGSLDDPSLFKPDTVLFARDRHLWDVTAGSLTEYETMPPPPTPPD